MKRYIFFVVFFAFFLGFYNYFIKSAAPKKNQTITKNPVNISPAAAPTDSPEIITEVNAAEMKPDIPVKLIIPAINLESRILPVGLTQEKIVDVPTDEVGWYRDGTKPGEIGSAVLDGHFKNSNFGQGIFNNLYLLKTGDDIFTEDNRGNKFHFKIVKTEFIDTNLFPVSQVYGQNDKPRLNLITCGGVYDRGKGDYLQRTIIYSEMAN